MSRLILALMLVALPMVASAAEETAVHKPGRAPKSWVNPNDIFHFLAHACDAPAGTVTCGPDNIVSNPFSLLIEFDAPVTQAYTRFWIITDTEGNVEFLDQSTTVRAAGTNTLVLTGISLPGSGDALSRGLYKFISIVAGENGKVSLSNYYPFRVLP